MSFLKSLFDDVTKWNAGLGGARWALWLLVGAASVLLAMWLLDQIWKRLAVPVASKSRNELDGIVVGNLRKPLLVLLGAGGAKLVFDAVIHHARAAVQVVPPGATLPTPGKVAVVPVHWTGGFAVTLVDGTLFVAVVLAACSLGYALMAAICDWYLAHVSGRTRMALDDELIRMMRRLAKIVAVFVGITIILQHFDVKISALLGIAGVASLAVALASKDTIANMISGFTILVDRPFRVGDRVELGKGVIGDVKEIGLRSTKILTFDNTLLVLPNTTISSAQIVNQSYPDHKYKIRRDFTVAYGSDVKRVKRVLRRIARDNARVLRDPKPRVFFVDFADSALVFKLVCWIEDYKDRFKTIDRLNMEVDRRFREEGIQIPFPQRDIHIRTDAGSTPLHGKPGEEEAAEAAAPSTADPDGSSAADS